MSKPLRPITAAFAHLLIWSCVATAQQSASPAAPTGEAPGDRPAAAAPKTDVEESLPSVYYLPDAQGRLQPVLDFSYQDFMELYKLKHRLDRRDEPPRYSLQRMVATGTAGPENAELEIQFQILTRDDGWVRAPLRLEPCVLHGEVQYRGEGEQFVHFEGEGEGYVLWLRGKAGSQHEITMRAIVPLAATGDRPRLKFCIARAVESELKLTVPIPNAMAKVSEGAVLSSSTAVAEGTTQLNVAGLGGEFVLDWWKPDPRGAETPLALEATGTVSVKFDDRSIATQATLAVRSYGAPFDRFVVRLPPGAELLPGTPNGYTVVPLKSDPEGKEPEPRRSVAVQLSKKTAGPVEVQLACRRDYDPSDEDHWWELAGFEIPGAVRQWGTIAVAAPADRQVFCDPGNELREAESLPEALRKEDVAAGFEYAAQPYSLTVRLAMQQTHVEVDPKYVLRIDADRARLEGQWLYTIRGAKAATLEAAMPGWVLDQAGPDDLVAEAGATITDGRLSVPLARPVSGSVELRVLAHRPIDISSGSLRVELPQPQAHRIGPARLTVVPADNLELIPEPDATEGLTRQPVDPASDRQKNLSPQRPPALDYLGDGRPAVFAACARLHGQEISADTATQVTLRQHAAEVEQRQTYRIAYEPADRLNVAIPRDLAGAKHMEVFCNGRSVALSAAAASPGDDPAAPATMQVTLLDPVIGSCELVLRYAVPLTEPKLAKSTSMTIPLPMPAIGRIDSNRLTVTSAGNALASLVGPSAWTIDEDAAGDAGDLRLRASRPADRLDLKLRWVSDGALGATIVHRAWIQSWLSAEQRQDRAAYLIATRRKQLDATLPAGAELDRVFVDGRPADVRPDGLGRLRIPLSQSSATRRRSVELLYHFQGPRPPRGDLSFELPRIGVGAWTRQVYWQLVLPADEHVVANPAGFTGEFAWGWRNYFWGRQPLLDQDQLEAWVGAVGRTPLPERTNQYLYSSLGDPGRIELRTAARTWIVFWASGIALVVGLLLIYVPWIRHPAALLVLGVALLAIGLIAPEPTLLLAQAASLGLALMLLSRLLERVMTRRRRRTVVRKEPSSAQIELGSTHGSGRLRTIDSLASTETLPAIQPSSSGNAER